MKSNLEQLLKRKSNRILFKWGKIGSHTPPVDKTLLVNLIQSILNDPDTYNEDLYTPESWAIFTSKFQEGIQVKDNPDATQEEVDTAYLNLLNAIAGLEEVPSGDECVYPLDKTDFSDVEQIFGMPQGTILAPTPIDDSYQKFVVNSLEDKFLAAAPQGVQVSEEGDWFFGNSAPLTMGTTIALKYKALDFELWNEDQYEFRFIISSEEQSTDLVNVYLGKSNDYSGLGKFPWNSGQPAPSLNDIPTEGTIVFVREYYYCYMVLNGEIVGTWYNNRVFKPEDIIDWGIILTGNHANPIELELITDYDTLSSLLSGVEFTHTSPADFKPATLCGQLLDLTPIEPEECVYPLDASSDNLELLGLNQFTFVDECYNHISQDESIGEMADYKAIPNEVILAVLEDRPVSDSALVHKGTAFEFEVSWKWKDIEGFQSGVQIDFGTISGAGESLSINIFKEYFSTEELFTLRIQKFKDGDTVKLEDLYVSSTINNGRIGFNVDKNGVARIHSDIGGLITYDVEASIENGVISISGESPLALKQALLITKGKDLQFAYPEGTVGLDGNPV